MSRKSRYPEPTPEELAEQDRVFSTLKNYATGQVPVNKLSVQLHMNPFLQLAEFGGELDGERFPPLSVFPIFKPHLDAAAQSANGPLLAALTLALMTMYRYERHMPGYAKLIRQVQWKARLAASKRRAEGDNVGTRVEAWERDPAGEQLTPHSRPDRIAVCAAMIGRSERTVLDYLYLRERARRNAR